MVSKKKKSIKPETSSSCKEPNEDITKENILPIFWDLASLKDTARCGATVKLITTLKQLKVSDNDRASEKESSNVGNGDEKDDVEDEQEGKKIIYSSDPVIQYSIQRLVKGLGSGRKLARVGFATALLEVLQDITTVDLDAVKEGIDVHLKVSKSLKGQEEKDAHFGRLFGLIILAKCYIHKGDSISLSQISDVVKDMLNLSSKKVYLREVTSTAICDLCHHVSSDIFRDHFLVCFKSMLCNDWSKLTSDDVFMILRISDRYEMEISNNLSEEHWSSKKILETSNFERLSKTLAESSDYTLPNVHSIWKIILPRILAKTKDLQLFWSAVIEETIMQSSHERKFLGLSVLQLIVSKISSDQVGIVFSPNLMRTLVNAFSSSENYLHQLAKKFVTTLPDEIQNSPNTGVAYAIVDHLLTQSPAKIRFDEVSRSKVIEKLVGKFTIEEANKWTERVMKVFVTGQFSNLDGSKIQDLEDSACRQWALNQLLSITKCKTFQSSEEMMMSIMEFLFLHSHFNVIKNREKTPTMNVIEAEDSKADYHKQVQMRFEAALKELSHHQPAVENGTTPHTENETVTKRITHSTGGVLSNGEFVVYRLVMYAKKLLSIPKYVTLVNTWQPEAYDMFQKVMDKITKIKKQSSSTKKMEQRAFELLLLHCVVRLFTDSKESIDVIEELIECHNKITQSKTKSDESEPHWTEVVTEILLSLLTQPSNLMRHVVDIVAASIVNHMTPEAVKIVMNSLKPEKMDADSQLQMENSSDEEEEVEDENDNNDKADDDKKSDEDDSDDDNSSDDDDDDDDDEDDNLIEIDEKLRLEVKAALGSAAIEEEDENDDEDDDEEELEDEDMDEVDDSVLDAMDKALGAVFKSRIKAKSAKKSSKEMKQSIIHFKLRVLDVVDLIIKRRSADSLVLDIVEPLYQVVLTSGKTTDEKAFNERAKGLLTGHLCKIKTPKVEQAQLPDVVCMITRLMDKARCAPSCVVVSLISSVVMFLIRVVRGNLSTTENVSENEEIIKISSLYKSALNNFMIVKQSHLQPIIFRDLVKRFPEIAWTLADDLPTYCNTAVNVYRKLQAVELLELMFHNQPKNFKESYKGHLLKWVSSLTEFLNANAKETTLKSKQLTAFFKLLKKIVDTAITLQVIKSVHTDLVCALQSFHDSETSSRSPSVDNQINQMLALLKRSSDDSSGKRKSVSSSTSKKRKKQQDDNKIDAAIGNKKTGKQKKPK